MLSVNLAELAAMLEALTDEALWNAARSHLATDAANQLEGLNHKRQREGLTQTEEAEAARLIREYERFMLTRAQAAVLLKQRGYDISSLITRA